MNNKLNLSEMLDFSDMDLTAPDKVVEKILTQLPETTRHIISGSIVAYDGPVTSYTTTTTSIAAAFNSVTSEKHIDIQDRLGKVGEEDKKFECFLYTAGYTKYKYRIFFMKYGIANYPVQFTLEESVARSFQGSNCSYIITCNNRDEVESLLMKILTSKKIISVMQELIRIYQANTSTEIAEGANTLQESE